MQIISTSQWIKTHVVRSDNCLLYPSPSQSKPHQLPDHIANCHIHPSPSKCKQQLQSTLRAIHYHPKFHANVTHTLPQILEGHRVMCDRCSNPPDTDQQCSVAKARCSPPSQPLLQIGCEQWKGGPTLYTALVHMSHST
jgi:hypothetical protein